MAAGSKSPPLVSRQVLSVAACVVVLLLIGAGAWLRVRGINWDQWQHVHPDERFIVWVADTISMPSLKNLPDLASALDPARSTINPFRWPPGAGDLAGKPRAYAYGHVPLYLLVLVAHAGEALAAWLSETTLAFPAFLQPLHTVGRHLAEYSYLALVGRVISTLCDLGTLVLVYAMGRRAFGQAAGLLSAVAYAFAVLPIQLSHFYAVDMVLTFCVVATVALAARWAEQGGRWTWILAGVMYGLAVGSKFSAVLLLAPLAVAAFHRLPEGTRRERVRLVGRRLAVVGGVGLVTFALTNPFAILDFGAYVANILAQNAMVSGLMDAPYTRQYIGTAPFWYFVQQLSQWGLGWPLGLIGWAGLVWLTVVTVRRGATPSQAVILAWTLPYFLLTGGFHTKFLRYMAPLVPFLLVCGGGLAVHGYRWLATRWGHRGRVIWAAAALGVTVFTVGWALAFAGIYGQEHPWIQASRWIYANIPEGSKVLSEHWDDALPLAMDEITPRIPTRNFERVELPLYDPDSREKLDALVAELSDADYLVIASNRLYVPIQRLPRRYPMTSHYYRLLFDGDLGYRKVAEFSAYPRLDGVRVPDDHADESFTVYDHPRAMIFENVERLKPELLRARLERYLPLGDLTPLDPPSPLQERGEADASPEAGRGKADASSEAERGEADASPEAGRGQADASYEAERGEADASPEAGRGKADASSEAERGKADASSEAERGEADASPHARGLFQERGEGGGINQAARPPGRARYASVPSRQGSAPESAVIQPADPVVVPDFRWNRLASESPVLAVLLWWFVLSLLGWLTWPLIFPLLGGLRDRGYGLARLAGWVLVGWVHWLGVSVRSPLGHLPWSGSSLWQNRSGMIALVVAGLAIAGLAAAWVQRGRLSAFCAERRRLLVGEEALFAGTFLAFVGIRLLNPDLWQPWNGGEKFMEFAFLNAILRSPSFPPYDPYFAGGVINYYYYGLYLVSLLIKLTGIVPEVAFNLAVPGLFALTALALFSVGLSLARRNDEQMGGAQASSRPAPPQMRVRRAAISAGLGVVLVLLMSNLSGFEQLLSNLTSLGGGSQDGGMVALIRGLGQLVQGAPLPGYDFWAPSRVIPHTINEFPFWSFLFADLHPHLVAIPFGVLVVGLMLNWVLTADAPAPGEEARPRVNRALSWAQGILKVGLIVIVLGAMAPINAWDLPTYWALAIGALLLAGWRGRRLSSLGKAALLSGVVAGLAVVAYWPFYANYRARLGDGTASGLGRYLGWTSESSPLRPWLTVWGFSVFLALSFVVFEATKWLRARRQAPEENSEAYAGEAEVEESSRESDIDAPRSDLGMETEDGQAADGLEPGDSAAEAPTESGEGPRVATGRRPRFRLAGLLALFGLAAVLMALQRPTAALVVIPLGVALSMALRRHEPARQAFAYWLFALGLGILAGVELIYLRDFLDGGEWRRMNTVFKFSMPAWVFLGLAGATILLRIWDGAGQGHAAGDGVLATGDGKAGGGESASPAWWLRAWRVVAVLLVAAGLVFLALGTSSRVQDRFPGARPPIGTLDGMAYMTVGKYTWPNRDHVIDLAYDYLAIHWLLDHVEGAPVIAEAPAGAYVVDGQPVGYDYYRAGGLRVASMTGFPTFLGQHQYEQRSSEAVGERTALGQEFFRTTDIARARELLDELRVDYVYVGQLERILFAEDSLRKFDVMADSGDLEVVYRNPATAIYRVRMPEG